MNILLIQRDGVDLHHTLFASETSRLVLRFYHPKKKSCGVYITVSTLGSALSLVSELRWYIRRYVKETLFEVTPGIFCTRTLAQDVYYERTAVLGPAWPFRRLYGFRQGKMISSVVMSPGLLSRNITRNMPVLIDRSSAGARKMKLKRVNRWQKKPGTLRVPAGR